MTSLLTSWLPGTTNSRSIDKATPSLAQTLSSFEKKSRAWIYCFSKDKAFDSPNAISPVQKIKSGVNDGSSLNISAKNSRSVSLVVESRHSFFGLKWMSEMCNQFSGEVTSVPFRVLAIGERNARHLGDSRASKALSLWCYYIAYAFGVPLQILLVVKRWRARRPNHIPALRHHWFIHWPSRRIEANA